MIMMILILKIWTVSGLKQRISSRNKYQKLYDASKIYETSTPQIDGCVDYWCLLPSNAVLCLKLLPFIWLGYNLAGANIESSKPPLWVTCLHSCTRLDHQVIAWIHPHVLSSKTRRLWCTHTCKRHTQNINLADESCCLQGFSFASF